jgi:small-conductance mechanosensitive channel
LVAKLEMGAVVFFLCGSSSTYILHEFIYQEMNRILLRKFLAKVVLIFFYYVLLFFIFGVLFFP